MEGISKGEKHQDSRFVLGAEQRNAPTYRVRILTVLFGSWQGNSKNLKMVCRRNWGGPEGIVYDEGNEVGKKNEVPAPESFLLRNCYRVDPLKSDSPSTATLPSPCLHSAACVAVPPAVTPLPRVLASVMAGAGSGDALCLSALPTPATSMPPSVVDVNSGK